MEVYENITFNINILYKYIFYKTFYSKTDRK